MYTNTLFCIIMKRLRQTVILDLVTSEVIRSQNRLRRSLLARGFKATQATISRDIKDLRLVKRASDGAYQKPAPEAMGSGSETGARRAVEAYVRRLDRVDQLIVLKTEPGQAQPLALAVDRAELADIVGTIAGDDTILVIGRSVHRSRALVRLFEGWAK